MVFDAFHNQRSGWFAGGHVVEVCIRSNDCGVVFDIIVRVLRICVPRLCSLHLVRDTRHRPALGGVVVVVVGVEVDILPIHIDSRNVDHVLLVIVGNGILNGLLDTWNQRGGFGRKDGIELIVRFRFGVRIRFRVYGNKELLPGLVTPVCIDIAAGDPVGVDSFQLRKASGGLRQRSNQS